MIGVEKTKLPIAIDPETPLLALRTREAAKALGISERLLWEWTDKGVVPHVRLGKAVLYPVDSLREWLKGEAEQTAEKNMKKFSDRA